MPAIVAPAESRPARRLRTLAAVLLALLLFVPAALGPLPARAQGTPGGALAPGNPPLTRQVTDAFAETVIFALQVVATGETWDLERADEASFKDAMAQGLAAGYPGLAPEAQQALGQLPLLRTALRQAWPVLPAADREALRAQLRPGVQAMLDELDCQSFVELASADFVEGTPENLVRLLECWDEAVPPAATPAPATPASPATPAPPVPSAQPSQPSPVAQQAQQNQAYRQAQQGLMSSHNTYIHMSNVLTQNHAANMNAILTMGGSPYRYEVKYR